MTLQTAWTKLDMINLAFNVLGKKSINDLMDSSEFSDSANRVFDVLYLKEIAQYDWRFASKIQVLSQNVIPPADPYWQYAYNLPSDYLALGAQCLEYAFKSMKSSSGQMPLPLKSSIVLESTPHNALCTL